MTSVQNFVVCALLIDCCEVNGELLKRFSVQLQQSDITKYYYCWYYGEPSKLFVFFSAKLSAFYKAMNQMHIWRKYEIFPPFHLSFFLDIIWFWFPCAPYTGRYISGWRNTKYSADNTSNLGNSTSNITTRALKNGEIANAEWKEFREGSIDVTIIVQLLPRLWKKISWEPLINKYKHTQ